MKKIIAVFLILCLAAGMLTGCAGKKTEETVTVRLGGLKGPTTMGMVKLLDDAGGGKTKNVYSYQLAGTADELTPKMLRGELDIIAVPANLGAILNAKSGGEVQMLAVCTLGVLYLVEKGGEDIENWESLRGRTVYATGKGSTPEYVLRYLLTQNGLDPDKDVNLVWKSEPTEVVAQMATEEKSCAMLPQPFVTVAKGQLENLRVAMDLTEEWNKVSTESQLITAGLMVRKAFADAHPEQLETFFEEYAASAQYVNENTADASALVEKYGIVKAAVAEKAIAQCNIVCLTGDEMRSAAEGYFAVLFEQEPSSVGGALPGESFYREIGKGNQK